MAPTTILPRPPPTGCPVPNTHHAVSVQMTTWEDMQGMMLGHPRVKKVQQIGYPRSFLHQDIVKVINACLLIRQESYESCLLYPSPNHAISCREHLLQAAKYQFIADNVDICAVDLDFEQEALCESTSHRGSTVRLYAIFFPENLLQTAMAFWRLTGTGISSRLAQKLHENLGNLREAPFDSLDAVTRYRGFQGNSSDPGAMNKIRERISSLLRRASILPAIGNLVSPSDIYLYPTGMSAIYHCNILLQTWMPTESIVFGFPYELTLKMLQTYGKSCRFYGFGTPDELKQLGTYLQSEERQGRRVQSVWCECASNPLLRTVDLNGIRMLADKFGFQVVVDDTIGSFANIDVLGVADIIVTSLTKSFSGNGDVMGGSIVLNPASRFYETNRSTLSQTYRNELYGADARKLEYNSRKFLPRAARMNETASYLVTLLERYALNPASTLTHIYYPRTCWSLENYQDRMRHDSPEFTPGYGGLFTLEFEEEKAASTFFNTLEVHKGPSLGITVTLAQPYVQTVFANDKVWAASYGLSETIVRISVGLEDQKSLARAFKKALKFADCTKDAPARFDYIDCCT